MDSDNKNNLNDSNEVLGENNFLNESADTSTIRDGDEQSKNNDSLYTEIKDESSSAPIQYNYSEDSTAEDKRKDNTAHDLALASMILGIVSIISSLICCCSIAAWVVSIICAIVGIILGVIAKDSKGKREGMAIAGIICSIVAIVISVILLILLAIGIYADSIGYF
ncbi:MAG: DUF4190 domain-containing protein [Clostridium butyricum]|nr:DUF4190 domain-containing protein [Clostridium butyricum]